MDGPRYCHTEWSKSDRGIQVSYDIKYGIFMEYHMILNMESKKRYK